MGRQLFIHHYLPSHLASALLAGSVLSFIISEKVNFPISVAGRMTRMRTTQYADLGIQGPVVVGIFAVVMFAMLVYLAPLTYGTPG
jgi:dolichyl-phosphate-mannose-protein mannosyltransferase